MASPIRIRSFPSRSCSALRASGRVRGNSFIGATQHRQCSDSPRRGTSRARSLRPRFQCLELADECARSGYKECVVSSVLRIRAATDQRRYHRPRSGPCRGNRIRVGCCGTCRHLACGAVGSADPCAIRRAMASCCRGACRPGGVRRVTSGVHVVRRLSPCARKSANTRVVADPLGDSIDSSDGCWRTPLRHCWRRLVSRYR